MPGWIVQRYVNVPAFWNVNEKRPPAGTIPEFHTPLSEVVVCSTPSPFVHVTVDPTATVTSSGEYARLPSVSAPRGMPTVDADPAGVGPVDGDVGVDGVEDPPHAAAEQRNAERRTIRNEDIYLLQT
jgi:hypothetical protein